MSSLERALCIAASAHADQVDKAGEPYILHVLRVMLKMATEEERLAALLHDIVEDTPWTISKLREEGFPEQVLQAVDGLTRRDDEDYECFVRRASCNAISRRVKRADLEDNANLGRLANPSAADYSRTEKYRRAIALLDELSPCPFGTHV